MNLKNTGRYGVVIQYDNEDLAKMLVVAEHEAIELRDLLNREFPVAVEPAPRLHIKSQAPSGDSVLARCVVCNGLYDDPVGCPGEPAPNKE